MGLETWTLQLSNEREYPQTADRQRPTENSVKAIQLKVDGFVRSPVLRSPPHYER